MSMFLTALTLCTLLLLPESSYAWGPGFHLQLGTTVLNNLQTFPAAVAALLGSFPNDFLYGCISADITLGKKYTGYLLHCHRWHIGRKLLTNSETDAQRACAYGYISHLAADTIAHCYYVPLSIMRSYQSVVMKHAYWEVRFDSFTPQEIWDRGRRVALDHFQENDELLRREISNTIFSFGTNKKIFNSILLVSRLEKWQQLITAMHDVSRFQLGEEEVAEFTRLSEQAVFETLADMDTASWLAADPTGEQALLAAESVRKNLRLLYLGGKITKGAASQELCEMKKRLERAILQPEELNMILSRR
jgi:Zinc dependent phospholipase C